MADGLISPLALTAGRNFYNTTGNTGITTNAVFSTTATTYNNNALMANLLPAITAAASLVSGAQLTLGSLNTIKTLGNSSAPALADSVPLGLSISIGNTGLVNQMLANASTYLGSGNFTKFAQAYGAALGYISITNNLIISAANANDYLGPAFSNLDDLITGDLAKINLALEAFGEDLANLGELFNFQNLDVLNTPAGILNQLAQKGNMIDGTLPAIQAALNQQGLTNQDIANLVNINVQSLFNPDGLTTNQFDQLQKQAYPALCNITGADLQDVVTILDVNLPNIDSMCGLLDPKQIFPISYLSLTLPTVMGDFLIYDDDGSVSGQVEQMLNDGSIVPKGCDQLAKILPADQAAATRALQLAFAQVKNIGSVTLPDLAQALS